MSVTNGWSWERRQAGARIAFATALAGFGAMALGPAVSPMVASAGGAPTAVIVRGSAASGQAAENLVARLGGRVGRHLGMIDGFAAVVNANDVGRLRATPGVMEVSVDAPLQLTSLVNGYDQTTDSASLYSTAETTGARSYWNHGFTGKGVDVALIDSGVVPVNGLTTPGKVINGPDLSFDSQVPGRTYLDAYGHGTHMAGIIAGRDDAVVAGSAYAYDKTNFIGIAPDSRVVNVKVADSGGAVDVSQVIAGIDWVVQHRTDNGMNIRVLNLSFGTDSTQPYVLDPLAFAAEVAWRNGIVVVAAVGNGGSAALGVSDPASDPYVIAVGAADTNGTVSPSDDSPAGFSASGNGARNPDLLAPGVHIASLRNPGSTIDQQFGGTATVGGRFFRGSGTSQATAVMSGAAALVISQHPAYTPDMVKRLLTKTATPLTYTNGGLLGLGLLATTTAYPAIQQGSGELNLRSAGSNSVSTLYKQTWAPSQGTGTLQGARGSLRVTDSDSGISLTGEKDIFGSSFNSAAMAQLEAAGQSWSGGTWNGQTWSGQSWSGQSWSGQSWSGQSWSGQSWSGQSWSGQSWSGQSWSEADWS
ncbi:MAG TPA: S8 family serine peptidase [Candidatus Dormibacteraeota bacterium]|jgi:serine protease AprX|nr:S8 family serine peptidase [Candidatus Dormibacteraeota bacterium]